LEISAEDDERSFKDTAQSRTNAPYYIVILVVPLTPLKVFLAGSDKDLYIEAIKLLYAFFLGEFSVNGHMDCGK